MNTIILASKSKVRKDILNYNGITFEVVPSNIDEDVVKQKLIKEVKYRLVKSFENRSTELSHSL